MKKQVIPVMIATVNESNIYAENGKISFIDTGIYIPGSQHLYLTTTDEEILG